MKIRKMDQTQLGNNVSVNNLNVLISNEIYSICKASKVKTGNTKIPHDKKHLNSNDFKIELTFDDLGTLQIFTANGIAL